MSDALSHCYRITLACSRLISLIDSADVSISTPAPATDAAMVDTLDLIRTLLQSEDGSGQSWINHPQHVARLEGFAHDLLAMEARHPTSPHLRNAARMALNMPPSEVAA